MLQNTGNCVGFISEIWEIKTSFMCFLKPLLKKHQLFTQSPSLGSITATHKLCQLKTNQNTLQKISSKTKQTFLVLNLVNTKCLGHSSFGGSGALIM